MNLDTLINSDAVITDHELKSKKRVLERLAEKLSDEARQSNPELAGEINPQEIFQLLTEREKLGSTSLGHGVALPHARTRLTDHAIGVFMRLDKGVDFDSPDHQPTDLIFALMVPEQYTDEHLKILAYLATLFNDEAFCRELRQSKNRQEIYNDLTHWQITSQAS